MRWTHLFTHPWPFSKSKFNLKSDRVNLVAPASPIECLLYLPNVRAIQYKLGPERLTWFGNSNVLRLPLYLMKCKIDSNYNLEMKKTGFFRSLALKFLWYELKLFKGEKVFFFLQKLLYIWFFSRCPKYPQFFCATIR